MPGQRYKPAVLSVMVLGVKRPGLRALLAERGVAIRTTAAGAAAALVGEGVPRPICPSLVEATTVQAATALLDGGADDVVLSSDPDALVASRIRALIRRSPPLHVKFGDIVIDTMERTVTLAGKPLSLLPREYALLSYLARHCGKTVDHATLHRALWRRGFDPGTNVIAVHISRLRGKLAGGRVTVMTERGKGYRLAIAEPLAAG